MVPPPCTTSRGVAVQVSDGSKASMLSVRLDDVGAPALKQCSEEASGCRFRGWPAAASLLWSHTLSKLWVYDRPSVKLWSTDVAARRRGRQRVRSVVALPAVG